MKIINFIIYFTILLFIVSCGKKNNGATNIIFEKHQDKEGFYYYDIPPALIKALIFEDSEKAIQLKTALQNLDKIKILIFRTYNRQIERKEVYYTDFNIFFKKNNFIDLAIIIENKQKATIKYFKSNDLKRELVILLTDNNSFIALSLTGNFDYDTFLSLLKFDNIDTLIELKDN